MPLCISRKKTPIRTSRKSQPRQKAPVSCFQISSTFIVLGLACVAGCSKKPVAKNDRQTVTTEVVSSAQEITHNKAQVVIRPQIQSSRRSVSVDDIYISLASPQQASSLERSLNAIAERHDLAIRRTTASAGVMRFDFSFKGQPTHTIHLITPLFERNQPLSSKRVGKPGIAHLCIIIDDLGYDGEAADAVIALPFPVTVSVLPHLPISSEIAEEAFGRGDQVLLHLPMESDSENAKSEEIELRVGMKAEQVSAALSGMLETVPHVVGVNNHQGSRATSDPALMEALMPLLRARLLFFIDSRTDARTVAYDIARRDGVPAASRKVFLDDRVSRDAIIAQLNLAARDAARDGFAIAIGHPRPATIAALTEEVPRLQAQGVRFVFASDVVHQAQKLRNTGHP